MWAGFIYLRIVSMMAFSESCIRTLGFNKGGSQYSDQATSWMTVELWSNFLWETTEFSHLHTIHTGSEIHPASCSMNSEGVSFGGKQKAFDVEHSPSSSAKVKFGISFHHPPVSSSMMQIKCMDNFTSTHIVLHCADIWLWCLKVINHYYFHRLSCSMSRHLV